MGTICTKTVYAKMLVDSCYNTDLTVSCDEFESGVHGEDTDPQYLAMFNSIILLDQVQRSGASRVVINIDFIIENEGHMLIIKCMFLQIIN